MLRAKLLIFVLLMCMSSASAQSFPNPTIDYSGMPTPEMVVTPNLGFINVDIVPHSDIYNFLSTAVANVNELPSDIGTGNGQNLVQDETATQLMGYAKWMFSATSAQELLGNTLAPIGINLYLLLTLLIFMAIAWTTLKIAVLIFRFVQYIVRWISEIIPG